MINKHPDFSGQGIRRDDNSYRYIRHIFAIIIITLQVISQTPLTEQEGGGASGGATAAEERKYSAAALKKRLEERNLMFNL